MQKQPISTHHPRIVDYSYSTSTVMFALLILLLLLPNVKFEEEIVPAFVGLPFKSDTFNLHKNVEFNSKTHINGQTRIIYIENAYTSIENAYKCLYIGCGIALIGLLTLVVVSENPPGYYTPARGFVVLLVVRKKLC